MYNFRNVVIKMYFSKKVSGKFYASLLIQSKYGEILEKNTNQKAFYLGLDVILETNTWL